MDKLARFSPKPYVRKVSPGSQQFPKTNFEPREIWQVLKSQRKVSYANYSTLTGGEQEAYPRRFSVELYETQLPIPRGPMTDRESPTVFKDFLKVFFGPVLVNKAFMLYFGLNYADHPGEGYGYGLVVTIAVFFIVTGRFLWKYRNIEDP